MQYKVNHNGVNCILPVFNIGMKKKIDEVNEQINDVNLPLDGRIDTMHEFLKDAVGEENLAKILGSDDIEQIDINDMNILYLKIAAEYDRPVMEHNQVGIDPKTKNIIDEISRVAKSVDTIQKANTQAAMMKK